MILSRGLHKLCGLKLRWYTSVLVMFLSVICITVPAAGAPRYVLSSIIGEGAAGSLVNGTASFPEGTEVPYAFTPAPGYSSVVVVIDGTVASSSGTITMNANRWLWVFGNPAVGTQFAGMMTVPADFTLIPYPEFYQQRPSFNVAVADPYCAVTSEVVAYPSSYLGAFPMPPVQGAPLPSGVLRGAGLKDYWEYGLINPATNQGCSGDIHEAFVATLHRLKKLEIDHIAIYQYAFVVDSNAAQLQLGGLSISDLELAWIVDQAKAAGLQVHHYMQIVPEDVTGVPLPAPSQAWVAKFLDGYIQFIVERATVAQQNAIEAFQLDWGHYWIDWTPYRDLFIAKMTNAAQQVRSVYSGKILYGFAAPFISGDPALLSNVDWLIGEFPWIPMSQEENANLTVPLIKQKYLDRMAALANGYGPNRKPMAWTLFAQSHRDYLLSGWVEDGFCVNGCTQQSTQIDFSVQAIAYEAFLEAIAEQTHFPTASVDAKAYWYVDVMLPKEAIATPLLDCLDTGACSFPNLSQSWRNKPAESILYQWFRRSSSLASAVLPASRSVQVGVPATAFATIINTSSSTVTGCGLSPVTGVPGTFTFQATDPSTNQTIGTPNTPVDVSGGAAQSYVFALTPTSPIVPTDVQLSFDCANSSPAPINVGLNTLLLSASSTLVPDIVALAATPSNDGIANIPGTNATGAFAVATVNVGTSGAITASADTGSTSLPVSISLCQTDPATGQCISGIGPSVSTQIDANTTPTFGIFVQGNGNVPFNPAVNRIFVRFKDGGGVTRGSTSVAVRTQ